MYVEWFADLRDEVDRAANRYAEVVAERDRWKADHAHLVEINAILRTRPDLAERAPLVVALIEERDRLRGRVAWLRRAYGKAWLRRRSMSWIIRDVNAARVNAKTERDRLRVWRRTATALLAKRTVERDRLRAVVERLTFHIRELQHAAARLGTGDDEDEEGAFRDWYDGAVRTLVQLDVSPTIGDRCPDCGNPDRHCDCPDTGGAP